MRGTFWEDADEEQWEEWMDFEEVELLFATNRGLALGMPSFSSLNVLAHRPR